MRKHLLGFLLGSLTCAAGVMVAPRIFFESGRGSGSDGEHLCSISRYSSLFGEDVVLWSCAAGSRFEGAREHFEFEIQKYELISRSDSRAVASYSIGELRGYCVLRFDGEMENVACAMKLGTVLDFDQRYFGGD